MKISMLFILLFAGITLYAKETVNLKLNLQKDHVYSFKSTSDQQITQSMNGMDQNSHVKSSSVLSIKMMEATPDFMVLHVNVDSMQVLTEAMGMTFNMTSANKGAIRSENPGDIMSYFIYRLTENPIFVQVDYQGKLLKILNLDVINAHVYKSIDSLDAGKMTPMIKTQVSNIVGESTIRQMVEGVFGALPGNEVTAGDKWTKSMDINSGGMEFKATTDYKLNEIKENKAFLYAESIIEPASSEPVDMNGMQMINNVRGITKSDVIIDTQTGLQISNTGKVRMEGDMSIDAGGRTMNIPMIIDGTTKIELID